MGSLVYHVPAMSRQTIRGFATAVRFAARGPAGTRFDIVDMLENAMYEIDPGYNLEVAEYDDLGSATHGLTIPSEKTIIIREDIYEGACNGHGRDRFTLAHELGHYLLHHRIGLARRDQVRREQIKPFNSSEWQADAFAGELLIPIEAVRACRTVAGIAAICGVSQDAALTQIKAYRRGGLAIEIADA
jgi:uncharacterized protein DUF955